jgi:nucleoside-diphosphate-sugar epimerase
MYVKAVAGESCSCFVSGETTLPFLYMPDAVSRRIPGFSCSFEPDFRQIIAESWPRSIDDSDARNEWGWKPAFDLERMSDDMIRRLREK